MRKQFGFSFLEIMISVTVMTILGVMLMSAVTKRFLVGGVETDNGGVFYCYKDTNGNLHSRTERVSLTDEEIAPVETTGTCRLEISGTANISITAIGGGGGGAIVTDDWAFQQNLITMKRHDGEILNDKDINFINLLNIGIDDDFVDDQTTILHGLGTIGRLANEEILPKRTPYAPGFLIGASESCIGTGCVPTNAEGTTRSNYSGRAFFFHVPVPDETSPDVNGDGVVDRDDNSMWFRPPLGYPEVLGGQVVPYRNTSIEGFKPAQRVKNKLGEILTDAAYNQIVLTNHKVLVRGGDKTNSQLLNPGEVKVGCTYQLYNGLDSNHFGTYATQDATGTRDYRGIYFFPTYGYMQMECDGSKVEALVRASSTQYNDFVARQALAPLYSDDVATLLGNGAFAEATDAVVDTGASLFDIRYFSLRANAAKAPYGPNGQPGETSSPVTIRNAVNYEITLDASNIGNGGSNGANGTETSIQTPIGNLVAAGGTGGQLLTSEAIDDIAFSAYQMTGFYEPAIDYKTGTFIEGRPSSVLTGTLQAPREQVFVSPEPPEAPRRSAYFDGTNPTLEDSAAAVISRWNGTWSGGSLPGSTSFGAGGAGMQTTLSVDRLLGAVVYRRFRNNSIDANERRFISFVNMPTLGVDEEHVDRDKSRGGGGAIVIRWTR